MEGNSISSTERKLKLFGVELDPSQFLETGQVSSEDSDESVTSSQSSTEKPPPIEKISGDGGTPPPPRPSPEAKKFKCPCCFKVFANSQAMGGHQNAHKNERLRQKKVQLQLQARNASSLNYYYINPIFNKFCDKEVNHISFGSDRVSLDMNYDEEINYVRFNNNYMQNKHVFSLTHVEGSRYKSPSSPKSKRICTRKLGLDLQLGLGL